ncbi:MAG: quinone-dependent dihydroorotate dehydrogenase [Solirubrobacteraceae bacterium]|nr:quinone-dependent dihydroorotate dehydrogenase [Solirubrobacteraceae bacterium]
MEAYPWLAAALFRVADPERAHRLALTALRTRIVPAPAPVDDPRLRVRALGIDFPNPIGMAAGFDKDAEAPDALLHMGFGFTEVGTVTPKPQPGNPRPRMFRLPEDDAVINRLGFNNAGHPAALARLGRRAGQPGIVGVNVGANKDAADRVADYVSGIHAFASLATYFTVNVSSPNTPGLRDLQAAEALDELLARVLEARDAAAAANGRSVPVLLKVAPDLDEEQIGDIARITSERGIDGLIVSNTTVARPPLTAPAAVAGEAGGLSGRPLFEPSTIVLARLRALVGPELPIIGVGGIATGDDAFQKLAAGATLVQLYSAMIYRGPWIAVHIARELLSRLDAEGIASVADLSGRGTDAWAARPLP